MLEDAPRNRLERFPGLLVGEDGDAEACLGDEGDARHEPGQPAGVRHDLPAFVIANPESECVAREVGPQARQLGGRCAHLERRHDVP